MTPGGDVVLSGLVWDCCAIGPSGRFDAASAGWDLAIGPAKNTVKVMVAAANHRVRVNRVDLNPAA